MEIENTFMFVHDHMIPLVGDSRAEMFEAVFLEMHIDICQGFFDSSRDELHSFSCHPLLTGYAGQATD